MKNDKCNACSGFPTGGAPCEPNKFTQAVVEINNPKECPILFHKVVIPVAMGDETAVPPEIGKYSNVLLVYEINNHSYLYSSDGIPTRLNNGITDYEESTNLPQINGVTLLGNKSSSDLNLASAPVIIQLQDDSWVCDKTLEQIYDAFNAGTVVALVFADAGNEGTRAWPVHQLGYNTEDDILLGIVSYAQTQNASEFTGTGGYGVFTLYSDHAANIDNLEWQRPISVTMGTGLSFEDNDLSGVPATSTTIGMVKPGAGLSVGSDGTLSVSIPEDAVAGFDTVADMKANENLVDGSFAHTLGYYDINDGGSAYYRISGTEPSGYYETLNSGLYASVIYTDTMNVECFGAKGDDSNDDTNSIIEAVTNVPNNTTLIFSKTYRISNTIEITKPITITGGGVVKPIIISSKVAFKVTGNIIFDNLTIDGELNVQDQFDEDVYSELILLTGIRISHSTNVEIKDVTLKNYYGDAIEFFGYKQINIKNCLVDNVGGHWHVNNAYDSFGDGFYFGGTNGESYINIDNCILNGKYKNTTLSRCGVCVENLTTMVDTVTHINMNNTKLNQYDRIIHIEANRGEVWINGANNTLHGNAIFNHTGQTSTIDKAHLTLDNSIISYTGNDYSGTRGIRAFTIAITNSKIDGSTKGAFSNFGTKGYYDNCVFSGIVNQLMCENAGSTVFKNSTFNFSEAVTYIFYGSTPLEFDHCTFNGVGDSVLNGSNSKCYIYSCTFNSFMVRGIVSNDNCFKDLESVINMSSNFVLSNAYRINFRATSFYIGGVLQFLPNIGMAIPVNNIKKFNYIIRRDVPASGTIPILPTWANANGYRANSRYILITVSTNDWTHEAYARAFNNVYYNYITTDNSGTPTIGATQQKGTVASSYAFTVDDTNHTFARSGNLSSLCISYLLDISDLDYLSNWA